MKGILFKAWKAEAIRLSGPDRAWQTRRALKPQPTNDVQLYMRGRWTPRYNAFETVYVKERYDAAVWPSFPPWKSPLFMPASAARTLLLITSVRCERTRDISWQDCIAEGVREGPEWYFRLYDSINGAGAHLRNWDWVYEFRRVETDHLVGVNKMVEPSKSWR